MLILRCRLVQRQLREGEEATTVDDVLSWKLMRGKLVGLKT